MMDKERRKQSTQPLVFGAEGFFANGAVRQTGGERTTVRENQAEEKVILGQGILIDIHHKLLTKSTMLPGRFKKGVS